MAPIAEWAGQDGPPSPAARGVWAGKDFSVRPDCGNGGVDIINDAPRARHGGTMLKLYSFGPRANSLKPMLTLYEKGLEFEIRYLNPASRAP